MMETILASVQWPVTPLGWVIWIMPWFMSGVTVYMTWLTGTKDSKTWVVGLFGQVLWTTWIVISGTWSLIPVNLTLWILYYRNHRLWKQDRASQRGDLRFVNTSGPGLCECKKSGFF